MNSRNKEFCHVCFDEDDDKIAPKSIPLKPKPTEQAFIFINLFGRRKQRPAQNVTRVIETCIAFIDRHGQQEEGIYRVPGSHELIKLLQTRFNQEINFVPNYNEYSDVNCVASLLRLQLKKLNLFEGDSSRFNSLNIHQLRRAFLSLEHYEILEKLFFHFNNVLRNNDKNKMTAKNLTIIFSPTLKMNPVLMKRCLSKYDEIFKKRISV